MLKILEDIIFGQIRQPTTELAALEGLNIPQTHNGEIVSPFCLRSFRSDPFNTCR